MKQKLKVAIRDAARQKTTVEVSGVRVKQDGRFRTIKIVVRPLLNPGFPPDSKMVVFHDETLRDSAVLKGGHPKIDSDSEIEDLKLELQSTKESLQTTIEELETSNEELRATNEELQSVNEELQSSNEELKTSKEELHSTNEELTTVNSELQEKLEELSNANDDINNLLASTEIGTVFLDLNFHIKRFTPTMKKIFNLIASDVNRPISDITSRLNYGQLAEDAKTVLDTLVRREREVQDQEGRCYSVRIIPYRSMENIIEGVVVTFVDVTDVKQAKEKQQEINRRLRREIAERKKTEEELREARAYAENIVETVRDPLAILDAELRVKSANRAFYEMFQTSREETEDRYIYDLGDNQWSITELQDLLQKVIQQDADFESFVVESEFPGIGRRKMMLNARRIVQEAGRSPLILLMLENVTEQR